MKRPCVPHRPTMLLPPLASPLPCPALCCLQSAILQADTRAKVSEGVDKMVAALKVGRKT